MSHHDQPTSSPSEPTTFLIDLENITTTEYRFQNAPTEFILRLQGGPAKPSPELNAPERKPITITFPPGTHRATAPQHNPTPSQLPHCDQFHQLLAEQLGKALEQIQTLKERLSASLRNEDELVDRLVKAEQQVQQLQQKIPLPENFGELPSSPPENNPPAVAVTGWSPPKFELCYACNGKGLSWCVRCNRCQGTGIVKKTT